MYYHSLTDTVISGILTFKLRSPSGVVFKTNTVTRLIRRTSKPSGNIPTDLLALIKNNLQSLSVKYKD